MGTRNPVEKSKYIDDRYKEYLRSSFSFGDSRLQELFEERLEEEDLFKGPYLDLSLPFKRGMSINELIEEGVVAKSFRKLNNVALDRPLYAHQEKSLRHIGAGRNAIVTTGTGSGKTEAFLYPILNELLFDLEAGNKEVGVRALFLYPMNALVNDQVSRVREILQEFPDITFGFFTGDTPETASEKDRAAYAQEADAVIPPNEILSRKEIRSAPPHLLFTNYSMLEYLMIRPNDYAIFSPERLANWKYVVLDEAHSYNGSLGIELSYLMRRLTALAQTKPRFILSSATLGEKGKSEDDIVSFANKLTSSTFAVGDIVFADRISYKLSPSPFPLTGEDYLAMHGNHSEIASVAQRVGVPSSDREDSEVLFDLLANAEDVATLYNLLKNGSKSVRNVSRRLPHLSEGQLVALIDLVNYAQKGGIEIFSLKYHSFVRPLAGAYISLGETPMLSLTKTNRIEESRAFELGNCRYCNAPYIIGKVLKNGETGVEYLIQNDEVDIYENYGDNVNAQVDFFLLEKTFEESEIDEESVEKCELCSKCGAIKPADSLNANMCDCEGAHQVIVYKVLAHADSDSFAYNNLNKCPCCGRTRNAGVIKSLNLGKDETTAILAQTLLESMDSAEQQAKKKTLSLSLGKAAVSTAGEEDDEQTKKQFLAFSDSRSQASFFATFLNANHSRMLRRRLIWKVLEDNGFRVMDVEELEAKLQALIRNGNLFDNDMSPFKNAWVTVLVELLRIDGQNSCEGKGLYHFELDLSPIIDQFEDLDVAEAFGGYGFTTCEDLASILQVVFYSFAVDYSAAGLSPEERQEYLPYRGTFDAVELKSSRSRKGVRSFLPINNKDNMVVRFVQRAFQCDNDTAIQVVEMLFKLGVDSGLFELDSSVRAYRIKSNRFVLKNYRNTDYYRCSRCGRITPHNVHGVCPSNRCDGTLSKVDPDEALSLDFYRKQYKTKKVERLVVEEHTAQLDRKTAKQYQNDFKNKKINVLSCSTTFEMGVDIGSLETVFMRNVPPTPANYVQRAGRAGRRADSSAYILTYCGATSHDYTYFVAPDRMISGIINPPYFDVLNKKIILRHLMAASLGFFFRNNPSYFESVDNLVFRGGIAAFKEYVGSKPQELVEYIDRKVIPEAEYAPFHGLKWFAEMDGNDEKLQHFEDSMQRMLKEYTTAQEEAKGSDDFDTAKYFSDQIEKLHKLRVIDSLSEYCVIPKYGFPIDVVDLEIYERGRPQKKYDLSRDLKIGISEYAPGSEVIVDKKKFASSYITLPRGSSLPRRYYCRCPKCDKLNVMITKGASEDCMYCGESLGSQQVNYFLEPVYGFKTGESRQSSFLKPKRTYSGEVNYLGGGSKDGRVLDLGGHLSVETTSNDELLVMNRSTFYFCKVCGYGEVSSSSGVPVPKMTQKHKNYRCYDCSNEELEAIRLGHRFQTDVAWLSVPMLDMSAPKAFQKALSFMYALIEGMCIALEIERTDVDALLEKNFNTGSFDILVYDNVPGGAGLVKRLMSKEAVVGSMREGLKKVSQDCCDEETSCYSCLRNYYNQSHHGSLKRRYARELIEQMLPDIESVTPTNIGA